MALTSTCTAKPCTEFSATILTQERGARAPLFYFKRLYGILCFSPSKPQYLPSRLSSVRTADTLSAPRFRFVRLCWELFGPQPEGIRYMLNLRIAQLGINLYRNPTRIADEMAG